MLVSQRRFSAGGHCCEGSSCLGSCLRAEECLTCWRQAGLHYCPLKVVFASRGSVVLPTVLPLTWLAVCLLRWFWTRAFEGGMQARPLCEAPGSALLPLRSQLSSKLPALCPARRAATGCIVLALDSAGGALAAHPPKRPSTLLLKSVMPTAWPGPPF